LQNPENSCYRVISQNPICLRFPSRALFEFSKSHPDRKLVLVMKGSGATPPNRCLLIVNRPDLSQRTESSDLGLLGQASSRTRAFRSQHPETNLCNFSLARFCVKVAKVFPAYQRSQQQRPHHHSSDPLIRRAGRRRGLPGRKCRGFQTRFPPPKQNDSLILVDKRSLCLALERFPVLIRTAQSSWMAKGTEGPLSWCS